MSSGFDHGVGHPLLLLCGAKVSNYRKNKEFNDLGHYSEWPKVADAVIKALNPMACGIYSIWRRRLSNQIVLVSAWAG